MLMVLILIVDLNYWSWLNANWISIVKNRKVWNTDDLNENILSLNYTRKKIRNMAVLHFVWLWDQSFGWQCDNLIFSVKSQHCFFLSLYKRFLCMYIPSHKIKWLSCEFNLLFLFTLLFFLQVVHISSCLSIEKENERQLRNLFTIWKNRRWR